MSSSSTPSLANPWSKSQDNKEARTRYEIDSPYTPLLDKDMTNDEDELVPTCPPDEPSSPQGRELVTMDGIAGLLKKTTWPIDGPHQQIECQCWNPRCQIWNYQGGNGQKMLTAVIGNLDGLGPLAAAQAWFFFSSHLFSRVGSGWSCCTGQLPGMCHLYTGGWGCAGKQGQVQATAP